MSSCVLEVRALGKCFRVFGSEFMRVLSWFGVGVRPLEERCVLRGVSFSIAAGEAVGIVGQNGAGKSTLLKLIAGTLKPSVGEVFVAGRVAAILELGMGFLPDLTGRENVFHSAGLLGFSLEEIAAVVDEVADFAEIGDYFDAPVRTYSSGMQLRVAFAVATAYRPDVLIIDEALSVGDAYFQHKSLSRIREFQALGTTLLFVSHDRGAVQAICDRAILLDKGAVIQDGNPEAVMDFYNALIAKKEASKILQVAQLDGKVATVSGSGEARVVSVGLFNADGAVVESALVGDSVSLRVRVRVLEALPRLVVGYMIKDRLGQPIFGTNTHFYDCVIENCRENSVFEAVFAFDLNLGVGSYSVAVAVHADETHLSANYEWRDQAFVFSVVNASRERFVGSAWLPQKVRIVDVE